jgi:hypothetical protein
MPTHRKDQKQDKNQSKSQPGRKLDDRSSHDQGLSSGSNRSDESRGSQSSKSGPGKDRVVMSGDHDDSRVGSERASHSGKDHGGHG